MMIPYVPISAPFTAEQRAWLNGYLAGLFADANKNGGGIEAGREEEGKSRPGEPHEPLLILFGSQTGTAEQLARRVAKEAARRGYAPRVLEMNAYGQIDWASASRLLLVTSTWGDGDPPDNATLFWQFLNSEPAPKLNHVAYSVLALGDSNYSGFCGAGKKFDARLEQLGAARLQARADCDTDYEKPASQWMENLWQRLAKASPVVKADWEASAPRKESWAELDKPAAPRSSPSGRPRFFPARLLTNRRLNGPGSGKDTRHFELSLEGSGLVYEAGDALGVLPRNCGILIEELLAALGFSGEEQVQGPMGNECSIHEAFSTQYVITQPAPALVAMAAERSGNSDLAALLAPGKEAELTAWMHGRDILDLLHACPGAKFSPVEFVGLLRKLQPRLYSISSSPKAHPGEVHLTVAVVRYEAHGRVKKGICSSYLAERVAPGAPEVPVFVQAARGFRLPAAGDTPVIMIGPGTGIAPFRAFLEERKAAGATGRNWLFFGDQRRETDFLYREELVAWERQGVLTRLELAFSRDQEEKVYVQHRMSERAEELWSWLEDGAHLYVCGDAKRMAKDVDAALHDVIRRQGGKSADQASEYVARLKTEQRYQRDVY